MNDKTLLEDFKNKKWEHLHVEGSRLGNTNFLLLFLKNFILGEKSKDMSSLDRLLDEQIKILYLRSEDIPEKDKSSRDVINEIKSLSHIETIFNEEAFDISNIYKILQNRRYTHLVLDDVRQKYDENPFKHFGEIRDFCLQNKIKILVSTTENRQQRMDYKYFDANLIFTVRPNILQSIYSLQIEDKVQGSYQKYSITMK